MEREINHVFFFININITSKWLDKGNINSDYGWELGNDNFD